MDDLLTEFLTETTENLAVIDGELIELERNPSDSAILGNIFRLVHTIKGTCGFLGLPRLEAIAHAGENVLGKLRDGALPVTADAVTSILRCLDTIRGLLAELEASGCEPTGDDAAIITELNAIVDNLAPALAGGVPIPQVLDADSSVPTPSPTPTSALPEAVVLSEAGYPVAGELIAEVEAAKAFGARAATEAEIAADLAAERQRETQLPVAGGPKATAKPEKLAAEREAKAAEVGDAREPSVVSQSIRVPVDTLDSLMTLVSELVLTRNQLLQIARGRRDSDFATPLQRLSHITTELQEGVMKTRMQPIGNAWAKLPRIVRDLAHESGKKIDLQMLGSETEVDRQVLELIKDPLTHMVRNSADHGIESPEERRSAGKAEMGTITLNAFHESGHIIIEIRDDGRGLNAERIRRKAVASGLISDAESMAIPDQQLFQFIFKAGFSTAEKVTTVSGRGVGMDVVRTNIDRIGGNIDLRSSTGFGSTFVIKIPLTLAIVSALIVSSRSLRFALPQICVLELVRTGTSETRIERINNSSLLRLRDQLLPVVELSRLLQLSQMGAKLTSLEARTVTDGAKAAQDCLVIVSQVGTKRFGIIVDEVFDTEEIVVKPMAPILHGIPYYAGNTILGDGSVIMILDPNGLASTIEQGVGFRDELGDETAETGHEKTRLLLFRAGNGETLKAIPLELVSRLEEIDGAQVEHAQGRAMLQYRGHLMPLVPYDPSHEWRADASYPVLVFSDRERCMGLVVDEIIDIVEEHMTIEVKASTEDLIGSAIIGGRATDVIDVARYLTAAFSDWFDASMGHAYGEPAIAKRILLVEDSPFFRNLLTPMLDAAGYMVTAVGTATEALNLRERGASFDAIISDIEMPGMSGFEFAEAVRADGGWRAVPIIALSSYTSDSDLDRGHACGFTDYVAKFDREGLMQSLLASLADPHTV